MSKVLLLSPKRKWPPPLKRQTIPRLELCGAKLLAQLLHHTSKVLEIPLSYVHAWCNSTIVLSWLDGSLAFVGNRVSTIIDLIPPNDWKYVPTGENPADCASRGLFPSELITHHIWWKRPKWLQQSPDHWPHYPLSPVSTPEEKEITLTTNSMQNEILISTQILRWRFSGSRKKIIIFTLYSSLLKIYWLISIAVTQILRRALHHGG